MILASPDITIINGGRYTLSSPLTPMTGQPWFVEISNFSPENLTIMSAFGAKQITPYTVDIIGDAFGEIGPDNLSFSVADPAGGVPNPALSAYYVSLRWATWPDSFTQSYPAQVKPPIVATSGTGVSIAANRRSQSVTVPITIANSFNAVFPNNVSLGSTLIIAIESTGVRTPTGVSDNLNGAWILLLAQVNGNATVQLWGKANSLAGAITVTVTYSAGSTGCATAAEYAGMPAVLHSLTSVTNADNGASHSSGYLNIGDQALLIGAVGDDGSGNTYTISNAPFTLVGSHAASASGTIAMADSGNGGLVKGSYALLSSSGGAAISASVLIALAVT